MDSLVYGLTLKPYGDSIRQSRRLLVRLSQSKFAELAGVTPQAIHKAVKSGLLVRDGSKLDTDHVDNLDYLDKKLGPSLDRKLKKIVNTPQKKKKAHPHQEELTRRSFELQKMELDLEERKLKLEQQTIDNRRQAGRLLDFDVAEYLFLGYLDAISREVLGIPKKLEATIENFVKEGDSLGLIARITQELTTAMMEIKNDQKAAIDDWQSEL